VTNVRQEIITPLTLALSCEVVHEKLCKSVNICNSYGEKLSGTFLCGHGVYMHTHSPWFVTAWVPLMVRDYCYVLR